MNVAISIILLISYLAFVIYIMKGGNLLMGFIMMSCVWIPVGVLGGQIDWATFNGNIMQTAPSNIGGNVVLIFIGSWLGQVLLKTGIASTIIRKTVELGGDKPLFVAVLLSILTTLIFCSAYGAGAVIGIGVIVLPILLSLGVPKAVATASYLMSVGAGMYTNAVIFSEKQAVLLLNETNPEYTYQVYKQVGMVATGVQLVIIILMLVTMLGKKKKNVHAWAAPAGDAEAASKDAPLYALLAPFLPVILIIFFKWNSLPAFLAAIFYALFTCGYGKSFNGLGDTINRTLYERHHGRRSPDRLPVLPGHLHCRCQLRRRLLQGEPGRHHPHQHPAADHRLCYRHASRPVPWPAVRFRCRPCHLRCYQQLGRVPDSVPVRRVPVHRHRHHDFQLRYPVLEHLGHQLHQGFHQGLHAHRVPVVLGRQHHQPGYPLCPYRLI